MVTIQGSNAMSATTSGRFGERSEIYSTLEHAQCGSKSPTCVHKIVAIGFHWSLVPILDKPGVVCLLSPGGESCQQLVTGLLVGRIAR